MATWGRRDRRFIAGQSTFPSLLTGEISLLWRRLQLIKFSIIMALVTTAGSGRKSGLQAKVTGAVMALVVLCAGFGCASTPPQTVSAVRVEPGVQQLNAGDVIRISFPGAPNLDETQTIRRDGKVNLQMIGEIVAADKTPSALEQDLIVAYSGKLLSKEIKVTVISSSFAVYVTGAVMKPGKIQPDRAVTVLDAIMEAGGFDHTRANMKEVRVIRQIDGHLENHTLDLKAVLEGRTREPFYLRAHDTVLVPEKFSWF
jgi:polysaccharide biosynthesis/export protein